MCQSGACVSQAMLNIGEKNKKLFMGHGAVCIHLMYNIHIGLEYE